VTLADDGGAGVHGYNPACNEKYASAIGAVFTMRTAASRKKLVDVPPPQ
jgi:hypothetical protein